MGEKYTLPRGAEETARFAFDLLLKMPATLTVVEAPAVVPPTTPDTVAKPDASVIRI